jgi:hypothetical protein
MSKVAIFKCDKCDYTTSRKFNYLKHIKTDKHKSLLLGDATKMSISSSPPSPDVLSVPSGAENPSVHRCPNCNRSYMAQRSLWRHLKECQSSSKPETLDKNTFDVFTTTIRELCKSNAELNKMNQMQHSQMTQMFTAFLEASKNMIVSQQQATQASNTNNNATTNNLTVISGITNINNSNNKTFNLDMFLNETCKDAMNMSDFVKTIEVNTEDMENVGTYGYVKGMSNILINNLEKTHITKRPIHCSDSKRDVLYIKDDNKWERDSINSQKLVNAVKAIDHKNYMKFNEWANQHPECLISLTPANDTYMKLARAAEGGIDENITKVIKRVVPSVVIDKKEHANQIQITQ